MANAFSVARAAFVKLLNGKCKMKAAEKMDNKENGQNTHRYTHVHSYTDTQQREMPVKIAF